MRRLILGSHAEHVSYEPPDTPGAGVGIGVVDTLHRLGEDDATVVAGRECCVRKYVDDPPDRTGPHGLWVFDVLQYYAPESSFHLYLAGVKDGERTGIPQMAYGRAVSQAIEDEVDVVNVSAGRPRPNCTHGHCAYCRETKRAADNGVTVVAAAGNDPNSPVHCPANDGRATCVGGAEAECTFEMGRRPGYPTPKPPGAYWTRLWSGYDDYPDGATDGTFCTTRDCLPGIGRCEDHRTVTAWNRNPRPAGDKPDVLAPVHYAAEFDDECPFVWAASSFATPVVAACVAGTLSRLDGDLPPPHDLREAIREESEPVDSGSAGLLDATAVGDRLRGR